MNETALRLIADDPLTPVVLPLFALAVIIEAVWSFRAQLGLYDARDTATSLTMLVISLLVQAAGKLALVPLMIWLHEHSPLRDAVGRQAWAWALLFVLDDFTYYWFHRLNHEVRLLWAGHVNHHSSEYLNYGTALRQGVGEEAYKFAFWLWLPLLGFDPAMVLLMIGCNLTFQFWVHTEAVRRLPAWYEADLQHALASPRSSRLQRSLSRSQPRGRADPVGQALRDVQRRSSTESRSVYGLTENLGHLQIRVVVLEPRVHRVVPRHAPRGPAGSDRLRYLADATGLVARRPRQARKNAARAGHGPVGSLSSRLLGAWRRACIRGENAAW